MRKKHVLKKLWPISRTKIKRQMEFPLKTWARNHKRISDEQHSCEDVKVKVLGKDLSSNYEGHWGIRRNLFVFLFALRNIFTKLQSPSLGIRGQEKQRHVIYKTDYGKLWNPCKSRSRTQLGLAVSKPSTPELRRPMSHCTAIVRLY